MRRLLALLVAASAALACSSESPAPAASPPDAPAIARVYLDSAITLMQTQAFFRRRVNWDSVRANAHVGAAGAIVPAETYPAIRQALLSLGDHHSTLILPSASALAPLSTGASSFVAGHPVDSLDAELLGGRFGFIDVPSYSPPAGANVSALADALQAGVRAVDTNNPCGWIIDLRHNLGGNMWPMLVGIGPILGNDQHAGAFVDADSGIKPWYHSNGVAGYVDLTGERLILAATSQPYYVLQRPNPPVAVLTDSLTASSGEAIAIAFRGLPRARSFGGSTYGVPTGNAGFRLPDGAILILTVSLDVDRSGAWYAQRIAPDQQLFLKTYPATDDAVVTAAMNWLSTRAECSAP